MAYNILKVDTDQLRIGMFVSELDRPWLETPFLLQGVKINSDEDIQALRKYCEYVYIDIERGIAQAGTLELPNRRSLEDKTLLIGRPAQDYVDKVAIEKELLTAKTSHKELSNAFNRMYDDIALSNKFNLDELKPSLNLMVESVIRNPDAFVWLAKLKNTDKQTYGHSISSSIWAVSFGRQLGLRKIDLNNLALGAALFDLGKMKVSRKILEKKGHLTEQEFSEVKRHVEYGLDILKDSKGVTPRIREMVYCHHERFDGSGYPQGLQGTAIPLFARIASIVDCYDAITSDRPHRKGLSPSEAVKCLYEWRGKDFQTELIEEFIQAIGIYPAGSLVELSTGEVGVVLAEYRTRRLRPKLMMLLDKDKQLLANFSGLDLSEVLHDNDGKLLEIKRALEPGAYDIDPQTLYI